MKYNEITFGQTEAVFNKLGGLEGVRRFLAGELAVVESSPLEPKRLLESVSIVALDAVEHFAAKDKFRERKGVDGVQIAWIGENFQNNFGRKVEENVAAAELKVHRLLEESRDMPIIHEIGGEEVAETSLAHMWEMLKKQGRGESGKLLTNGYANIFYIRDVNNVLWAVGAGWRAGRGGWLVEAYSLEYPLRWDRGRQVLSR